MEKFEEAWKENRHVWESTKNLAKAMYLAGEEAQQAKVEGLEHKVKCEREISLFADKLCCELQKRIDDSIFILSTIDNPDEAYKAIDLLLRALKGEQALKGEGQ